MPRAARTVATLGAVLGRTVPRRDVLLPGADGRRAVAGRTGAPRGGEAVWTFPPLAGKAQADASWTATLDTLRAPRKTHQKLAEWRREAPIRPVVFEDAGVLTDDTVHLHLEQRMAQRLLARFRAQGFVHHDLSRACLVQAADSIPRVVLLGRLCLFGRRAERLHEVLVPVAARWTEPSRRTGPLRAYAEEAEARTLERLESALRKARAPGDTVHRRLLESAARDIEDLLPQLEERAGLVAESAAERLRGRGEREQRQLRETLGRPARARGSGAPQARGWRGSVGHRVQRGREASAASGRRLVADAPRPVRPRLGNGARPDSGVLRSAGQDGWSRSGWSIFGRILGDGRDGHVLQWTERPGHGGLGFTHAWRQRVVEREVGRAGVMTRVDDALLERMVQVIVDEVDPEQVILFGSHARGDARTGSDIDLVVVEASPFGPGRDRRAEAARLWRALAGFRVPKDILVFSRNEGRLLARFPQPCARPCPAGGQGAL